MQGQSYIGATDSNLSTFKINIKMETKTFEVTGMKCEHCKANVENALSSLRGVTRAEVSLAQKSVTVEYDADVVSPAEMRSAVADSGRYEMTL